jgi:hypothetical protein
VDPELGLQSHKKLNFYMKNILIGIGQKAYLQRYKNLFERQETRFICKFWSISHAPGPHFDTNPDSGVRTAKLRIHEDPDPQH